jgi:hypothetical protein
MGDFDPADEPRAAASLDTAVRMPRLARVTIDFPIGVFVASCARLLLR